MDSEKSLANIELWKLLREVENIDDVFLIEEVLNATKHGYSVKTQKVLSNYLKTGKFTREDRDILITHYVLFWLDEDCF